MKTYHTPEVIAFSALKNDILTISAIINGDPIVYDYTDFFKSL